MSAICGLWLRDGEPAAEESISLMMKALAHRGIDSHATWREGPIALGHQMFYITPESLNETLPLSDSIRQLTITANARISNRDELFDTLGITSRERAGMPDSVLILRAYTKWGEECVKRLDGVFAFAIWDAAQHKLLCVTDPMGSLPVYYFCDHKRFVFASEIKGVLAAIGVPRLLNEDRLLLLALPSLYFQDPAATHYAQIRRMPPATISRVTAREIQTSEYWRPDPERRLPYKTSDEITEALRDLLFRTVRAYTRSAFPVSTTLSGGLDSSAIASIASRVLAEDGRTLMAVCGVLPENGLPGYQDERNYIDLFKNSPNLELVYDSAPGRGPFDQPVQTVWSADSPLVSPHHYQITSNASVARERGARLILYGIGGEAGLTSKAAGFLAELLLSRSWQSLWREASAQARRQGRPLSRVLLREVIWPLLPWSWIARIRPAELATVPEVTGCILAAPFMKSLWERQSDVIEIIKYAQRCELPNHRANQLNAILCLRHFGGALSAHAGYEHVSPVSPWADRRVIEFCLAAPGDLKMKDGYARCLVREALAGTLPQTIRWRTTKGSAVMDIVERYNRQLPAVREQLSAVSPADPVRSIVDIDKLLMAAASELPGGDAAWREPDKLSNLWLVPSGVYLIAFLRQFSDFR